MAIDLVAFWERNFRRSITDRADRIRTEADHERWVKECAAWRDHIVEKEAKRLGMDETARKALMDACVRILNKIDAEVCARIFSPVAASG